MPRARPVDAAHGPRVFREAQLGVARPHDAVAFFQPRTEHPQRADAARFATAARVRHRVGPAARRQAERRRRHRRRRRDARGRFLRGDQLRDRKKTAGALRRRGQRLWHLDADAQNQPSCARCAEQDAVADCRRSRPRGRACRHAAGHRETARGPRTDFPVGETRASLQPHEFGRPHALPLEGRSRFAGKIRPDPRAQGAHGQGRRADRGGVRQARRRHEGARARDLRRGRESRGPACRRVDARGDGAVARPEGRTFQSRQIPDGRPHQQDTARRSRRRAGPDDFRRGRRGSQGRRVPAHAETLDGFSGAGVQLAARGVDDLRRRRRARALRPPAGVRAAVHRFQFPGLQPDRAKSRQHALALERRVDGARGFLRALRRLPARRFALAFAGERVGLRAFPRPQHRHPVDARRCGRSALDGDARGRPDNFSRAQAHAVGRARDRVARCLDPVRLGAGVHDRRRPNDCRVGQHDGESLRSHRGIAGRSRRRADRPALHRAVGQSDHRKIRAQDGPRDCHPGRHRGVLRRPDDRDAPDGPARPVVDDEGAAGFDFEGQCDDRLQSDLRIRRAPRREAHHRRHLAERVDQRRARRSAARGGGCSNCRRGFTPRCRRQQIGA